MVSCRKILIVSDPGQGNINPSLRLANCLLKIGVEVSICTSVYGVKNIKKETIPQGLTIAPFFDGHDNGKQPTTTLQQVVLDFGSNGACAVAELLSSATAAGQPFDYVVYTVLLAWVAKVANSHGVKSALFWGQPAIILQIYYYYFNGYEDLINGCKDNPTLQINLPGLPSLTAADLPSFLSPSRPEEHDFFLQIAKDHIEVLKIFPKILVNIFNELEIESIKSIDKFEYLPIGPLVPLDRRDTLDNSVGQWLNTQPKSSVVYVSFGTLAVLSMDQVEEIGSGLLKSGRPFLWVIRDGEQARKLSKIDELKKQGMIVDWCSQVAVLSHEATGCFLTHGGWNSTLEALVAGVPKVVFPQWSDQGTNAKLIKDVWKTGVRVEARKGDGIVEGKEIERCVELVMAGDGEMRRNAEKWKDLAREALKDGGSSAINIHTFLNDA